MKNYKNNNYKIRKYIKYIFLYEKNVKKCKNVNR